MIWKRKVEPKSNAAGLVDSQAEILSPEDVLSTAQSDDTIWIDSEDSMLIRANKISMFLGLNEKNQIPVLAAILSAYRSLDAEAELESPKRAIQAALGKLRMFSSTGNVHSDNDLLAAEQALRKALINIDRTELTAKDK